VVSSHYCTSQPLYPAEFGSSFTIIEYIQGRASFLGNVLDFEVLQNQAPLFFIVWLLDFVSFQSVPVFLEPSLPDQSGWLLMAYFPRSVATKLAH
jgi:hypothetical protein